MAAIARLYTSTPLLSQLDALFFRLFVRASLLAIFSVRRQRFATRALTLYKYDSAGSRMFEELAAGSDRFYATLPGSH